MKYLQKVLNKKRNLVLADKLQSLIYSADPEYQNIIKSLRNCSLYSMISEDPQGDISIYKSSFTCKNKYCFICNNMKSAKLTDRFKHVMTSEPYQSYFHGKYFYFITFTLRHNLNTRNYIYLDDLNSYLLQLSRRKIFQTLFKTTGKNSPTSTIASTEVTFTENGYNIHTHMLVITERIPQPAKDVQKLLQVEWKKITNDSWNVRFDLIKHDDEKSITGSLQELFKYSVKLNIAQVSDNSKLYKLGDWIAKTHRKKMFRTTGEIRKMGIFKSQYHYGENYSKEAIKSENNYYLARTSAITLSENIPLTKRLNTIKKDHPNAKLTLSNDIRKWKTSDPTTLSDLLCENDILKPDTINRLKIFEINNSQPTPSPQLQPTIAQKLIPRLADILARKLHPDDIF
jgi:hypothetical protein